MFDHVGVKVAHLATSKAFYAAALKPLGHVAGYADDSCASYGPEGAAALWLYPTAKPVGPGTHLAFRAADRAAVDKFYQAALKAGGRDNGPPGLRPDYSATYYAAFVLDPDGHNVEAVVL
jgi:catechol 2,3-dioxygenase-like lactoylglutathione lyase family enzyme